MDWTRVLLPAEVNFATWNIIILFREQRSSRSNSETVFLSWKFRITREPPDLRLWHFVKLGSGKATALSITGHHHTHYICRHYNWSGNHRCPSSSSRAQERPSAVNRRREKEQETTALQRRPDADWLRACLCGTKTRREKKEKEKDTLTWRLRASQRKQPIYMHTHGALNGSSRHSRSRRARRCKDVCCCCRGIMALFAARRRERDRENRPSCCPREPHTHADRLASTQAHSALTHTHKHAHHTLSPISSSSPRWQPPLRCLPRVRRTKWMAQRRLPSFFSAPFLSPHPIFWYPGSYNWRIYVRA